MPNQHHIRAAVLMIGTVVWVTIYGMLSYRLWVQGLAIGNPINLILIAIAVFLGVVMLLGWRAVGRGWLAYIFPWLGDFRRRALSLEQMYALTPSEFEDYVAQRIFARQGYQVLNTRDTKDGGIDIQLTDRRGQRAVVQCKRYLGTVGEPVVRDLYGTMINAGATHSYLVTTGNISADARKWAIGKPIDLVDGRRLVQLARH
ncbi:hypothetical protein BH10CHL1_BH10CHL1_21220 [soil metagenome]